MSRVFTGCMWLAAAVGLTFMTLPVLAIFLRVPPAELVRRLDDPAVRDALVVTAKTTLIAQAFILALGTPLAFVLATHSFRGRKKTSRVPVATAPVSSSATSCLWWRSPNDWVCLSAMRPTSICTPTPRF